MNLSLLEFWQFVEGGGSLLYARYQQAWALEATVRAEQDQRRSQLQQMGSTAGLHGGPTQSDDPLEGEDDA